MGVGNAIWANLPCFGQSCTGQRTPKSRRGKELCKLCEQLAKSTSSVRRVAVPDTHTPQGLQELPVSAHSSDRDRRFCCMHSIVMGLKATCAWQGLGSFRERDFMNDDAEHSDRDSDSSSQSPGNRSSRMRRMTFPIDDEDLPLQGAFSQGSSPRSLPESPQRPPLHPAPLHPASPQQSPLRRLSRPSAVTFEGQQQPAAEAPQSGNLDNLQQRAASSHSGDLDRQLPDGIQEQHQSAPASPRRLPDRCKSVDDGFNSDPEHCSRALRLKATQHAHSENHRASPEAPRHKGGIRRVASEAQLLSRYAGRAGTAQAFGSFGSHTSDSTRSFDDYLRHHRSPSPSPKSR